MAIENPRPGPLQVLRESRIVASGSLADLVAVARAGKLRASDQIAGVGPTGSIALHQVPELGRLVPTTREAQLARALRRLLVFDAVIGLLFAGLFVLALTEASPWSSIRGLLFVVVLFAAFFGLPIPALKRERDRVRSEREHGELPAQPAARPARRRKAPATYALTGVISAVSIAAMLLPDDVLASRLAKVNARIAEGELWRLVTPIFAHSGLVHLFFNMGALLAFGSFVEAVFGKARMLLVFFAAGIAASLASFLFIDKASVGASGAIFGLMGLMLVFGLRHRDLLAPAVRKKFTNEIALVIGINLLLGFLSTFIDNSAHLGGLVAGAALGFTLRPRIKGLAWVGEAPSADGQGRSNLAAPEK